MISVVTLVGQKSLGFDPVDKFVRQGDVVTLARESRSVGREDRELLLRHGFSYSVRRETGQDLGHQAPFFLARASGVLMCSYNCAVDH